MWLLFLLLCARMEEVPKSLGSLVPGLPLETGTWLTPRNIVLPPRVLSYQISSLQVEAFWRR